MSISVAVITCGPSDLLALLQKSPALTVEVLHPNALTPHCLDGFQCACVLGGHPGGTAGFPGGMPQCGGGFFAQRQTGAV